MADALLLESTDVLLLETGADHLLLEHYIAATGFANTTAFGSPQLSSTLGAVGILGASVFGRPSLSGPTTSTRDAGTFFAESDSSAIRDSGVAFTETAVTPTRG